MVSPLEHQVQWRAARAGRTALPCESGGTQQCPLHLLYIRAREFDPWGQAVPVQQKGPRVALHLLDVAVGIRDDLP
jgi:hypothetical protein